MLIFLDCGRRLEYLEEKQLHWHWKKTQSAPGKTQSPESKIEPFLLQRERDSAAQRVNSGFQSYIMLAHSSPTYHEKQSLVQVRLRSLAWTRSF